MRVLLFYGLKIEGAKAPFDGVAANPMAGSEYFHLYGGRENEGAAFVGVELLDLAEGQRVECLGWDSVVAMATDDDARALKDGFDAWWVSGAADGFREDTSGMPAVLLVADSD